MTHKKPEPLNSTGARSPCPVCGQVSYSRGGVHPQCSVKQADAVRVEQLKREKPKEETAKATRLTTRWQKSCPKCKAALHVRKKACECGYEFSSDAATPTDDSE